MTLKMEVFPAPFRPMMPHRSRSATVNVIFLKSSVAPNEMPTFETESRVTQSGKRIGIWTQRQAEMVLRGTTRGRKAKGEATDKMDPFKRESDTNRELLAQGIGNTLAGLLGGLPMTGVVVRSAANIDASARTRWSAIAHGVLLLAFVLAIPTILNMIPLAALAAMLLFTGFKLASPALFRTSWSLGMSQFIPFVVTVVSIVMTDLLIGIAVGLAIATFFILAQYLRQPALRIVSSPGAVLTRFQLPDQATFLCKANIERALSDIADGSRIEIDGTNTARFDYDVLEQLHEFAETAKLRGIDYRLVNVPAAPTTPTHSH